MTESLATTYRENHYIVVRGLFPKSLVENYSLFVQQAFEDEVLPMFARSGLDLGIPSVVDRILALIAQDAIADLSVKQTLLGHFPLSTRLSCKIEPIARYLGRSELMREIVGPAPLFMHMPPMLRFVPSRYTPAAVPPHQDASYNSHLNDFATIWVPLVPIDEQCGGLVVFEGSHRGAIRPAAGDANGWLSAVATDDFPRRQLTGLEPGDAVVLSPRLIHASAPNVSLRTRFSMDLRIFPAGARSTKHHMNLDTLEIISA